MQPGKVGLVASRNTGGGAQLDPSQAKPKHAFLGDRPAEPWGQEVQPHRALE